MPISPSLTLPSTLHKDNVTVPVSGFHAVAVDAEHAVGAIYRLGSVQKDGLALVLELRRVADTRRQRTFEKGELSDLRTAFRRLNLEQRIYQTVDRMPMPLRELTVSVNKQLLAGGVLNGGVLHVEQFVESDMQRFTDCGQQIHIRSSPPILPIAYGVSGNPDPPGKLFLLYAHLEPVMTDSFAENGNRGDFHRFTCVHINNVSGCGCRPLKGPPWHWNSPFGGCSHPHTWFYRSHIL